MSPDYYHILGVSPDVSLDAIKSAYRQKAMKCHPDRGGSHAQMLEINEAFHILSDAGLRKQYDYAREHQDDQQAQSQAASTSQHAREEAKDYPREWAAFDAWLNSVTADFKGAKYGSSASSGLGWQYPTADESLSGWLFIVGGGVAGILIFITFIHGLGIPGPIGILSLFGGAWLGRYLHQGIRSCLPKSTSTQTVSTGQESNIIHCPKCSQKLRASFTANTIRITCPSCKHVFKHASGFN